MPAIFIIEDDTAFRDTLAACLRMEGFEVSVAGDGDRGLALVRACPPDLLLCDIGLPARDGLALLDELRRNPRTARVPVIFLTARGGYHDVRAGMNLGADDYLVKPVELDDVVAAIRARLRRHEAANQARPPPSPEALRSLGLTAREAEILFWIAEGKANAEIAIILGMNLPTVKKHVHHVLEKLGVENRTSAANLAHQRFG